MSTFGMAGLNKNSNSAACFPQIFPVFSFFPVNMHKLVRLPC